MSAIEYALCLLQFSLCYIEVCLNLGYGSPLIFLIEPGDELAFANKISFFYRQFLNLTAGFRFHLDAIDGSHHPVGSNNNLKSTAFHLNLFISWPTFSAIGALAVDKISNANGNYSDED